MHPPSMFGPPFSPVWSGMGDSSLRPVLLVAREGSGYRPIDVSELGSSTSLTLSSGINVNVTGVVNNEQVTQLAGSGAVDTANKALVDSLGRLAVSSVDSVPASQAVYAMSLTGVGAFSNYSTTIPSVQGTVVLGIEPDSNNTDAVYYAFSGQAVTGNAFELRGDKVFSVSDNQSVYFAQATSGQRVMVHYQKY